MTYPKTLYLAGNPEGLSLTFETAEQEIAAMSSGFFNGYLPVADDPEPELQPTDAPKRRGRPPKQAT